ncbi:hypothetical protein RhiirA4_480319 [Rhizophagus irregularis]|uniref:RNase H type-1 domain-containing protein n=1 Tax=Rhizophagus irregularis TaxID=588596 RepID=A0A2I1HHQ7_9GLOM|nr:hypothetical protein RhiirA4_480319 [Rhizophagus irregularis]
MIITTFTVIKYLDSERSSVPINPPLHDNLNVPNPLRNMDLIKKLFDDIKISEDLQGIAVTLAPFIDLEFFTDGSYDSTNSQAGFSMGYGWTTSNLSNCNITYNGSLKFFPSSTKAETMAILTALVTLSLQVKLSKVKAHSGNHFNDIADIQAKLGCTQPIPTTIIHDHLPNQTITLNWNNEIPLDKDVRKCVGTILDYRRLDNH